MKTFRELINLVESAQNPVDKTVRVLPDVGEIGIDSDASPGNGSWYVKLYDGSYDVVGFNSEAEAWRELSSLQDLDTGDNDEQGVAEGATVDYEVEWTDRNTGEQGLTTVSALTSQDAADKLVKMKLQQLDNVDVTDVFPARNQNPVAEAVGRKDLISRLQKDLPRIDDPKNKDAEPVKWTGPKKGDYGYTGYQGHGMPTDKAERDRIRADKKKGLPEDEATARMGLMSAMGSNDNNPADQRRAMAQQAVEQLASKR